MGKTLKILRQPLATAALFGLALACRLLWAWGSGQLGGLTPDHRYDDGAYVDMALSFVGRSPETWITHPPGYPAYLLPFLMLGDWGIPAARFIQMLIGAALAPLITLSCRRMEYDDTQALIAGLIVAVHPMMIFFNARIMPETLFTLVVIAFFTAWALGWERGSLPLAAFAGVLGGLGSLIRGTILPFGAFLAFTAWLLRRRQPRWAALVAACGAAWALTIAPWTARNWRVYDRFIPISAQGGWNFYEGLTTDLEDIRTNRPQAMGAEAQALGLKDVFEVNDYFGRKAKAWITENPLDFVKLTMIKALRFWRLAPYPPHPLYGRLIVGVFSALVFALALWGLKSGFLSRPAAPFLLAWIIFVALLHSVFASNLRYRAPIEPFLAIAAGVGAQALLKRRKLL